jgi:hypothetical protein
METHGFSEAFSHLSSALLMIPDGRRLPLVRPMSQHIIQAVASRIPAPDASEIHTILDSEPLTRHLAKDLFQNNVVLQHVVAGTFPYNLTFSLLPSGSWCRSFGFQTETNTTLQSSPVGFESTPTGLSIDYCYFFNKTDGIRSYDAIIYTYANGVRTVNLLKVVADYESPIFLDELDRLEQKFPNVSAGKPGRDSPMGCNWRLVFIVPSSMRTSFATQPYCGVGKYDWESSNYFSQVVAGIWLDLFLFPSCYMLYYHLY